MNSTKSTRKMVVVSMLCAIAYLCMFVFRLKVGFLTFDAKDAILAIIALLYGPVWGFISAAIVPLLEMVTVSDTGFYGFIMNVLSSAAFVSVCGLVYQYKRSFTGAIVGVSLAALTATCVMILANLLITPYYMGVETAQVVAMIPTLLLPFNVIKSVLNAAITLAIYKPFTTALKRTGLIAPSRESYRMSKKSAILLAVSVAVVILSVVAMLLFMKGEFEVFRRI